MDNPYAQFAPTTTENPYSRFSPTSAVEVEKKPSLPPGKMIYTLDDISESSRNSESLKYPGESISFWPKDSGPMDDPVNGIVQSDGTILADEPKMGAIKAALVSAGVNAPASAAFLGALGASSNLPIPNPLVKMGAGLVGGLGAAMLTKLGQDTALENIAPSVLEAEAKGMRDQPFASTAGRMAVSGFKPGAIEGGVRQQIIERAAPAALGVGIAGGQEIYNRGPEGFQPGAIGRVLEAAGENALLNKSTRAGDALMGLGSRLAGRAGKSIVASADAAAGASTADAANAGAESIATEQPGYVDPKFNIGDLSPDNQARVRAADLIKDPLLAGKKAGEPSANAGDSENPLGYYEPHEEVLLKEKAAKDENRAQELAVEIVKRDNRSFESVVNERQKFPDTASWISDMERRLDTSENPRLPEKLDGFQPTEPKEPLDFGIGEQKPNEVQAVEGLDYLGKVRKIQSDLAREGVDLPRETAVKLANLAPEEFVRARQQLIDSVPKTDKPLKGELKLKSLDELEPGFFPPGQDFPQATPQKIAAEGLEGWADSVLAKNNGKTNMGLDPYVGSAQLIKTGFIAGRKIAATIRDFNEWSQKMVAELGESIKPHLDKIWDGMNSDPVLDVFGKKIPGATKGIQDRFVQLHQAQRYEGPEGMFDPRNNPNVDFGQGMWLNALEHVGDLVHRLSYSSSKSDFGGGGHKYGMGAALEKSDRFIRKFSDKPGWMKIGDDVAQNIENNFNYRKKNGEFKGTLKEFQDEVKAAGERYAAEYEKLNPVTEMQKLGRDAAIDVARFNFEAANQKLKKLSKMLNAPDAEKAYWTPMDSARENSVDSAVKWLESKKLSEPGMTFSAETAIFVKSWDMAIDAAIASIKAGAKAAEVIKQAVAKLRAAHPDVTPEQVAKLESTIQQATNQKPASKGFYESMVDTAVAKKPAEAAPASTGSLPGPSQWTPAFSKSDPGKLIKRLIGGIEDNIGAVSKPMKGAVRSYNELINDLRVRWSGPIDAWAQNVRASLTPQELDAFDRSLQGFTKNGHEEALGILAKKPNSAELIDGYKKAVALYEDMAVQQEQLGGRKVERIEDAWPRQMLDYEKFRKSMDMDEISKLEETINIAERKKKRQLTDDEKADIVNSAISLTLRGKPSFLKDRTVHGLTETQFKENYEPFDTAMANRIARVSTDVARRRFLGKGSPEDASLWDGKSGDFGQILSKEIAAGKINSLGQKEIIDNLKSLLHTETQSENAMIRLGNKLSRAQNFLFIGDLTSAIAQYADALNGVYAYGLGSTARGYRDVALRRNILGAETIRKALGGKGDSRGIRIEDLGLGGDTFTEAAIKSRGEQNTKTKRVQDWVVDKMVGLSDRINKEGIANAARRDFVNAIKDPASMSLYDKRYSEMFPDRWPQMKKDLMSKDFVENAKLNDNTRFFIYNELARFQPLTMAQRAQFESSDPSFRFLYSLKRYWVKELNIIRTEGYEKLRSKDPVERLEGAKNVALFVAMAAAKGAAISTVKDLLFDREVDASENAVEGVAQLLGSNKFLANKMSKDPMGALLSSYTVPPIANFVRDAYTDYGTILNDSDDKFKLAKYAPIGGKLYYNLLGAGADANEKAEARNAKAAASSGIDSPTLAEFDRLLFPKAKKQDR